MIYTNSDGGSRGNPGNGATGVVIRDEDKILETFGEVLSGKVTNNVAEYKGIIKALELASKHTQDEITCIMDSELIINQLLGKYRVKSPHLLKLFLEVQKLQNRFNKIYYVHKRREDNYQKQADYILNQKLDEKFGERK